MNDTPPAAEPSRPVVARKTTPPATGTDTVSVACKLPGGLILRRFEWVDTVEASPTGPKSVRISRPVAGSEFHIKGNAELNSMAPNLMDRFGSTAFPGGFAITDGVPADLWEAWHDLMRDSAMIREGLVFALPHAAEAAAEAKTRASLRSGLEAIDPDDHASRTGAGTRSRLNPLGGHTGPAPGAVE
jgi:hypothetical protein